MTSGRARGRPAGGSDARAEILASARTIFAARGYDGATIRAIGTAAGVDAALVHHYFGTKENLFVEAVRFPVRPADLVPRLLVDGAAGLGERLVRTFVGIAEHPASREALLAMIKTAVAHEASAAMLREFVTRGLVARLAESLEGADARLRLELAMAQLIGMIIGRYVLRVEPLASADEETLVALLAPTLQRYIDG